LCASDNPPWEELKQQILKADYLVLVLGDKYGRIDKEGIGYTEKEFVFAEENNIPILAFIKEYPNEINDMKLSLFRNKICNDYIRTPIFWNKPIEIIPCILSAIKKINSKEKKEGDNIDSENIAASVSLSGFLPDYPTNPIGSCGIILRRDDASEISVSLNHVEIMRVFRRLESYGQLNLIDKKNTFSICQIDSVRMPLSGDEYRYLEKSFMLYKNEYLSKLKKITDLLQTDDFNESVTRKFAYRIVRISYKFWKLLLKFAQEHDYLNGNGEWDMFSPTQSSLNVIHAIASEDCVYDGVMHAYFNVENTDEVGSEYVWMILNLEMTKDNRSNLQRYSKRNIWGCKIAYDWCINELFPTVCKRYKCKQNNCYFENNCIHNDNRIKISELQMFIIENGMQLSHEEIKIIQEALKYCLHTKILPINEYGYIISKLGLQDQIQCKTDARVVSEEILLKLDQRWKDDYQRVDADILLRCVNAFTDGYSKSSLPDNEVENVLNLLNKLITRMENIKYIEKYMHFYSND
jgi:hypothetical protein